MRFLRPLVAMLVLAVVTACGSGGQPHAKVAAPASATRGALAGKSILRIAVKVDQPGLGEIINGDPNNRRGFEIDVARYVAHGLGAQRIEWHDVFSRDRIKVITDGTADLVIAAFAISANRLDQVSYAGPYIMSGQDIIVRKGDVGSITGLDSLRTRRVCTIVNSTSVDRLVQEFGKAWTTSAHLLLQESTRQCINQLLTGSVDAVSTGNMILAGYVAEQPDRLFLVSHPFTMDNVGIGLAKGDDADIAAVNKILKQMIDDGTWAASIRRNFGASAALFLANQPVPGQLKPSWSLPGG